MSRRIGPDPGHQVSSRLPRGLHRGRLWPGRRAAPLHPAGRLLPGPRPRAGGRRSTVRAGRPARGAHACRPPARGVLPPVLRRACPAGRGGDPRGADGARAAPGRGGERVRTVRALPGAHRAAPGERRPGRATSRSPLSHGRGGPAAGGGRGGGSRRGLPAEGLQLPRVPSAAPRGAGPDRRAVVPARRAGRAASRAARRPGRPSRSSPTWKATTFSGGGSRPTSGRSRRGPRACTTSTSSRRSSPPSRSAAAPRSCPSTRPGRRSRRAWWASSVPSGDGAASIKCSP